MTAPLKVFVKNNCNEDLRIRIGGPLKTVPATVINIHSFADLNMTNVDSLTYLNCPPVHISYEIEGKTLDNYVPILNIFENTTLTPSDLIQIANGEDNERIQKVIDSYLKRATFPSIYKKSSDVIVIGDIHGEFPALFRKIDSFAIRDCRMVCVGDIGVGFAKTREKNIINLSVLNESCRSRGIEFLGIRGNHDDPWYFDGSFMQSNFKLLPDYYTEEINGELWQFIGGAISIDRLARKEGIDYWRNERVNLQEDKVQECDVLVTHTAPPWMHPPLNSKFVQDYSKFDHHLMSDLANENKKMEIIYDLAKPKSAYAGHFHRNHYVKEREARILDILDFHQHQTYGVHTDDSPTQNAQDQMQLS